MNHYIICGILYVDNKGILYWSTWVFDCNNLMKPYFWSTFEVFVSGEKFDQNGSEKSFHSVQSLNYLEKFQFNQRLSSDLLSITPILYFDPLSILLKTYFWSRSNDWVKIFSELQTRSQKKKRKQKIRGDSFWEVKNGNPFNFSFLKLGELLVLFISECLFTLALS